MIPRFSTGRTPRLQARRAFTYLELVASVMLVAMAGICAVTSWSLAPKAVGNKRMTEMSVQLAVLELERLKGVGYDHLVETTVGAPYVSYFDKNGGSLGSATGAVFKVKSWVITQDTNNDNTYDSLDLRELTVEIWNPTESQRYERAQTLLAFGGI
jgi:type II secretory pathway pseudopilin PulG